MASIEINFNIMSHPGRTDREAEASSPEQEEGNDREHDLYQPRSLFPNRMQQAARSEIAMSVHPYAGTFGHVSFGGNDIATRNVEYQQRVHNDNASDFLGHGLGLESREFPAIESTHPPSALFHEGDSFEIDDFTADLGRNPLIDMNEPSANFTVAQNMEGNNDSTTFSEQRMLPENDTNQHGVSSNAPNRHEKEYILSLYAHGSCAPQTHHEDMDRKPAAVDDTILRHQHQNFYHPNQQPIHPFQASNRDPSLQPNTNPLPHDQGQAGQDFAYQKPPPIASVESRSARAPGSAEHKLKPPPVASLRERSTRRSERITSHSIQKTRNKPSPKKRQPKATKAKRSKTRIRSRTKETMLKETRTDRETKALHTWFERLDELEKYKTAHGHANVPQKYKKNHSLGIWVNKQRMEKKAKDAGKPTSMTDDKVELLETLGFVWAKRKGQAAWEEKFGELNQYRQKHGHCNVPTKNRSNRALGRWVSTQRANYKRWEQGERPKNRRTDWEEMERRIQRLEAIGFKWSLLPGGTTTEVEDDSERDSLSKKEMDSDSDNEEKE